jgi:ADP-L-glycero-D-manno-heptose 6-epimerase
LQPQHHQIASSHTPAEEIETSLQSGTIIISGAYGFIGSYLVSHLNQKGFSNLILVDAFDDDKKELNLLHKKYIVRVERENLFEWLQKEKPKVDFIFHLGARTDTTEFDYAIHQKLNVEYSQQIWNWCSKNNVPLVYASSAATYGDGEQGYNDNHYVIETLQPLNAYGVSKNEFDKWAVHEAETKNNRPPFWAGLKFFNVYGPNEYHKGRMASVIFHSYNQILQTGKVKLFKSHKQGFADGQQLRDFVYVKDVAEVCHWFMQEYQHPPVSIMHAENGLYNLGTGKARSFVDLVNAVFAGLQLTPNIEFIDMPEDIRDKYQYFTEANMSKLHHAGYHNNFYSLENGVTDYVKGYLSKNLFY